MKKGDWNRYTIWLNFHGNLINVSDVVYRVVESQKKLKDDIKMWYDNQYHCRPIKVLKQQASSHIYCTSSIRV